MHMVAPHTPERGMMTPVKAMISELGKSNGPHLLRVGLNSSFTPIPSMVTVLLPVMPGIDSQLTWGHNLSNKPVVSPFWPVQFY